MFHRCNILNMNIIDRIREEQGLSYSALARMSGLKTPTVWRHCRGKSFPDLGSCAAYARSLGISFEQLRPDLFAGTPTSPSTPRKPRSHQHDASKQS
ncbi:transcriptional regulator cI, truncation [Nitratidesulfovibrio vulgaris str. Hildenborough]|uniref:Transcriptional regulator cI, truncation n=3 Tax=Nitratidesulfovibrio vulgaris TaxID=881 RepID=Q72BW6_NITV2|nr:transcriptional regulator cI, truncation [Nitratidesulfovibrio vulgaris str. Hildenborough]ADP86927.1 helix-turn-helix domain protein [Nitratidesulfovibrio vulgaris RCH1]